MSELKNISQKRKPFDFESEDTNDSEYFLVFREKFDIPYKTEQHLHGPGKYLWSEEFLYYFQKGFELEIHTLQLGDSRPCLQFSFGKPTDDHPDFKVEIGLRYHIMGHGKTRFRRTM
jgi:hypothetical protein